MRRAALLPGLSEVPVVHLQVAEAGLQAGEARRGAVRLGALEGGDGRHGPEQLRQRLRRTPLDLGGKSIGKKNRTFTVNTV